ncbi:MAG: ATP synthase F1 subunit delta [Thermodesulfovibrionales bacterium]
MRRQQAVKRYAKMFLNSVGIEAVPDAVGELLEINGLMSKSSEFRGLLENPLFKGEERERVMRQLSDRFRLSDNTVRFVVYLSEQRLVAALPELINTVTAIYLEKKRRAKALIKTPIDINRRYDDRLKATLKNLTGKDVDIEYVVDPSILGGVLIKVGSTMYDSSIKGHLRLLKDELVKG